MEGDDSLLFGMKDDANLFHFNPWELPRYFLLRHKSTSEKQKSLRTPSGYWKEKESELTAIRSGDESSSSGSPIYVGVRKTLEFYLKDGTRGGEGTKTHWIIHEYHHLRLRKDEAGEGAALFLEEDVVLRKVFRKGETDQSSSLWRQVESCVRAYEDARLVSIFYETLERIREERQKLRNKEISESTEPVKAPSIETSEGLNEDLGTHCHPDGKSDNVWKHFTKIRTNDADVVYAACHHCDKVLKAHPKIHGISQLRRHRKSGKCRSSCSNPSTDEDREMLHRLRAALDPNKQQKMDGKLQEFNAHLTQLNPWVLGHSNACYITTSLNVQTNEGCWEEIDVEFTAIRTEQQQMQGFWMAIGKGITTAIQNDYQMQMQVPQYVGLRRTLEFHLNQDGNKLKTGWIMLEYQLVDDIMSPVLFLQGDMVIRKVFYYDKDAATAIFSEFGRRLNDDNDSEEYYNGEGVNMVTTMSTDYKHGGGDRKRKRTADSKRTSEVWMYFTEIRTADHDVVYAVCHCCDRGYNGDSRNRTSHLKRHNKRCSSKHPVTAKTNNGANAAWEAKIWPLFLRSKNYGETEHQASGIC